MTLERENLIPPLVSHQATSIPPDSVRAANKGENDVVIFFKVVNQGHVDKTAQGFNKSGNQTLKNPFPW